MLGTVRDAEVRRERLLALLSTLSSDLVVGPVRARLDAGLAERRLLSQAEAVAALDTPRYAALRETLDDFCLSPPLLAAASARPEPCCPRCCSATEKRVRQAARRADLADDGDSRSAALHVIRKEAKRARYAAESARGPLGRETREIATAMTALQDRLGEVQDRVGTPALLYELAECATARGGAGSPTVSWPASSRRGRSRWPPTGPVLSLQQRPVTSTATCPDPRRGGWGSIRRSISGASLPV